MPYRARQVLWQNFGIPFADATAEDLINCIVMISSDRQREEHLAERTRIEAEQDGRH